MAPYKYMIYFHGFNSAPSQNVKVQKLEEICAKNSVVLLQPSVDYRNLNEISTIVDQMVADIGDEDKIVFAGTSMGGFLALLYGTVYQTGAILINPVVEPLQSLKKFLGEQTNYVTGEWYLWTEKDVAQFGDIEYSTLGKDLPILVLLDEADTVIDHYQIFQKLGGHQIVTFPSGSHRFEHIVEAEPYIQDFLKHGALS